MRLRGLLVLMMIFFICFTASEVFAGKGDQFKTTPTLNNGKKWNVGFWMSGSWLTFPPRMYGFVEELMALGWMEKEKLPENH